MRKNCFACDMCEKEVPAINLKFSSGARYPLKWHSIGQLDFCEKCSKKAKLLEVEFLKKIRSLK
jgi:hypothetical protein